MEKNWSERKKRDIEEVKPKPKKPAEYLRGIQKTTQRKERNGFFQRNFRREGP